MERRKLRGRIVEKYGTLSEFSRKTGLSAVTITKVLSGKSTPSLLARLGWCTVLDIPRDEMDIFFDIEVAKEELEGA